MDVSDPKPLIEQLNENTDDLEESLEPLLYSTLSKTAGKLPLLDRAKLYTLVAYTIESLLFSYLRLCGLNAKAHPVFRELTRVKQYFEKIQNAESKDHRRTGPTLDKPAAGRFIKHALAANNVLDAKKSEHHIGQKFHIRFDQTTHELGELESGQPAANVNFSLLNSLEKDSLCSESIQRSETSVYTVPRNHQISVKKREYDPSTHGESVNMLDSLVLNSSNGDNPSEKLPGKKRRTKKKDR